MKILIGSNGGLTGIYLTKVFRELPDAYIIGSDSSARGCGKHFVNEQLIVSSAERDGFVDELIELINREKIDFYFPTHSKEIRVVAQNAKLIKDNTGCDFLVSDICAFDELDNKKKMNIGLNNLGIPVPKLLREGDCNYPIVMKKDVGSGGSGLIQIENKLIHEAAIKTYANVSFYEKIIGTEYTADCLFDGEGQLLGVNQRVREKTMGGAVIITKTQNDIDILPYIKKMANQWTFRGCVNFQYIVADGIPYFIDINLRFPSGGLPLTVAQGFNIPLRMLDVMQKKNVEFWYNNINEKRMYRYFEELFEEV